MNNKRADRLLLIKTRGDVVEKIKCTVYMYACCFRYMYILNNAKINTFQFKSSNCRLAVYGSIVMA